MLCDLICVNSQRQQMPQKRHLKDNNKISFKTSIISVIVCPVMRAITVNKRERIIIILVI